MEQIHHVEGMVEQATQPGSVSGQDLGSDRATQPVILSDDDAITTISPTMRVGRGFDLIDMHSKCNTVRFPVGELSNSRKQKLFDNNIIQCWE